MKEATKLWASAMSGRQYWHRHEIWFTKPGVELIALKTVRLHYEELNDSHMDRMRPSIEYSWGFKLDALGAFLSMCSCLTSLAFSTDELVYFNIDDLFEHLPPSICDFNWHGSLFPALFTGLRRWARERKRRWRTAVAHLVAQRTTPPPSAHARLQGARVPRACYCLRKAPDQVHPALQSAKPSPALGVARRDLYPNADGRLVTVSGRRHGQRIEK